MIEFVILIFSALVLLGICSGAYEAMLVENLPTWSKCFVVLSSVLAIIFIVYNPSERLMPYARNIINAILGL